MYSFGRCCFNDYMFPLMKKLCSWPCFMLRTFIEYKKNQDTKIKCRCIVVEKAMIEMTMMLSMMTTTTTTREIKEWIKRFFILGKRALNIFHCNQYRLIPKKISLLNVHFLCWIVMFLKNERTTRGGKKFFILFQ